MVKNLALPKEISERKSTLNIHCQEWCWSSNTWLPDSKSWLIGKDPDARKDWLNRRKFEQTLGDSEGQESLECCSPWGCQESDTTEQLNNNKRETWSLPLTSGKQSLSWGGASGKEAACHSRRCKKCMFSPWVRKIPWRRRWQSTPAFLPRESHGQRSLAGYNS